MRVSIWCQQRIRWRIRLILVTMAVAMLTGCTTESARQTETSAAGGTPVTTLTPAGNVLRIDDEIVVEILVPDPEQPEQYALTRERLYRWENREWIPTPTLNDGRKFLVDRNKPERLFRGNHPLCGQESKDVVLDFEMSEDGGQTWTLLPNGRNVRPLAVDPTFPDIIYGTDCSLRISSDVGHTWRYLQPLYQHEIVDLVVVGERLLVLGISTQGESQVRELDFASPDRPQLSDIIIQVPDIATVDADDTRIVVGTREGVQLSLDGGQTWANSRFGLESVTVSPDNDATPDPAAQRTNQRFGIRTIEIDPNNSQRIFAGTVRGLYISQDDGGTWDLYREIDASAIVTDVQFAAGGADIYVTTDAGVVAVPNP